MSLVVKCDLMFTLGNHKTVLSLTFSQILYFVRHNFVIALTCLWLALELAGDFGKEFEGETSARLPVTYATFAVACLAALHSIGSKGAVCKGSKHFILRVL